MDMEGNIYDLRGNFIGTTDGDGATGINDGSNQIDSQLMMDGMDDEDED